MTIDSKTEQKILTAMIVDASFLKSIAPSLKDIQLQIPAIHKISTWCLEYFAEYQKAPGKHIQDIFKKKKKYLQDEEGILIEEFLERLSGKYKSLSKEEFNPEFLLDESQEYLSLLHIENLNEKVKLALQKENPTRALKLIREFEPTKLVTNPDDVFKQGITARELKNTNIQETKWLIEGIIPKGLTLFAGKPKVGKSYFLLNLALDLSAGKEAFNVISTEPSKVLYLGLEEPSFRTKNRIESILGAGGEWPDILHIFGLGGWLKSDEGGQEHLELWMKKHPDTKLIIIDTLERWKSSKKQSNKTEYEIEYKSVEKLHTFAGKHDLAIIVAHHLRKTKADDKFDEIVGGTGLQAAVDTLTILSSKKADQESRIYNFRGRDIGDGQRVFKFEKSGRMILTDENVSDYRKETLQRIIIQDCIEQHGSIKRIDLVNILSRCKEVGKGVDVILRKMVDVGRIEKLNVGTYAYKGCSRDIEHERKVRESLSQDKTIIEYERERRKSLNCN